MAEYYAVERSPEYLMHYGVKGMRWGVRKARQLGLGTARGAKKLAKQYAKAQKKFNKLSQKADTSVQKANEQQYIKKAKGFSTVGKVGAGLAAAGLGAGFGYMPIHTAKYKKLEALENTAFEQNRRGIISDAGLNSRLNDLWNKEANLLEKQERFNRRMEGVAGAGIGMALAGYTGYGINKLKARNARKLQTAKGNKAAIAERDAWQREMNKAFAGTQYAGNSRKTQVKMTQKQKRAYERAYGKPTLSRADANALAAIASNPEKYRVKKRK